MAAGIDTLATLLVRLAFRLLASDEADLYFAQGEHTGELLRDLVRMAWAGAEVLGKGVGTFSPCACCPLPLPLQRVPGGKGVGMCAAFMDAMLAAVSDASDAAAARKLARAVFAEFEVGAGWAG